MLPSFLSNNRIIAITAGLILVAVGLGVWQFTGDNGQKLGDLATSTDMQAATSTSDSQNTPPTYEKQFSTQETQSGPNQFVSKPYNFTFQYPQRFSVSAFDDRGGHVVLVQQEGGQTAVQIFITDWDEPTNAVTPERIKQDLPDLQIRNRGKMQMAGKGDALTFVGESEQFGTTREVWFARRGHLYQIITPVGGQEFLANLLETWQFN
jgi:hypothetical protein